MNSKAPKTVDLMRHQYSRRNLSCTTALTSFLAGFPGKGLIPVLVLGSWITFLLALPAPHAAFADEKSEKLNAKPVWFVDASHYRLKISEYIFSETIGAGGGITRFDNTILLIHPNGNFSLINQAPNGKGYITRALPYRTPVNRNQFDKFASRWEENKRTIAVNRFRVFDVVSQVDGENGKLWVSHHWWNNEEQCYVLRVSFTRLNLNDFLGENTEPLEWQTLHQTQPCLGFRQTGFSGHEAGGKLALIGNPASAILFTVGDHGHDGVYTKDSYAQDKAVSWGKVIWIDLLTGDAKIYSMGHRNPQGLFIDNQHRIWLTEHGPRGGDELNLLREDGNYGWPKVTYGTNYGSYIWPLSRNPARHDQYKLPMFAWVPSIAITDVNRLEGDGFPHWQGDLIVGGLRSQSIHRIHIRENRVILVEPIAIKKRLRDIIEGSKGEIVLWTDNNRIIFIEQAEETAAPAKN